jgi:protein-serine/threonine kinase
MASPLRRPLPTPPSAEGRSSRDQQIGPLSADMHQSSPYLSHYAYPPSPSSPRPHDVYDEPPTTTLPGGTVLHQGFYDLLAMIPTPSPSRLLWGESWNQQPVVAGPRYEDLSLKPNVGMSTSTPPLSTPVLSKKGSKDMVSKPTRFVCVYCTPALSLCHLTLLPFTLFTLRMRIMRKLS